MEKFTFKQALFQISKKIKFKKITTLMNSYKS